MIPRRLVLPISLAAVVGCGAGQTIRLADEGDTTTSGPVALAPAPAQAPVSGVAEPAPVAANDSAPDPTPLQEQGYAPYGNARDLEVKRLGQWTRTGIGEARRMVIQDANTWAQFWSELATGNRPHVDFTQNIVVAVAAGERPTGGHEIVVERVTESAGELAIEVVELTPGANCMTSMAVTRPVDVVSVAVVAPRSWSFLEGKEIRGCR
ncbi:MAG: protease complex subunit PrcB family protein [Gemmatimonadales bacterium]